MLTRLTRMRQSFTRRRPSRRSDLTPLGRRLPLLRVMRSLSKRRILLLLLWRWTRLLLETGILTSRVALKLLNRSSRLLLLLLLLLLLALLVFVILLFCAHFDWRQARPSTTR
jgi:hypothetical protein